MFIQYAFVILLVSTISTRFAGAFAQTSNPLKHSRNLFMSAGALPTDEAQKPFYALGVSIARQVGGELKNVLSTEEVAVMLDGFSAAMKDEVENDMALLQAYGPQLNQLLQSRAGELVGKEKKSGEDYCVKYLLENPKATRTASGLIFHETLAGTGTQPSAANKVEVHYHGTLTNGQVFDSSVDRGETISFPLANVIKGWQEGVSMMKEGGKATLVVPSDLAYGDNGSPPVIPPGATLKFEVSLIKVE